MQFSRFIILLLFCISCSCWSVLSTFQEIPIYSPQYLTNITVWNNFSAMCSNATLNSVFIFSPFVQDTYFSQQISTQINITSSNELKIVKPNMDLFQFDEFHATSCFIFRNLIYLLGDRDNGRSTFRMKTIVQWDIFNNRLYKFEELFDFSSSNEKEYQFDSMQVDTNLRLLFTKSSGFNAQNQSTLVLFEMNCLDLVDVKQWDAPNQMSYFTLITSKQLLLTVSISNQLKVFSYTKDAISDTPVFDSSKQEFPISLQLFNLLNIEPLINSNLLFIVSQNRKSKELVLNVLQFTMKHESILFEDLLQQQLPKEYCSVGVMKSVDSSTMILQLGACTKNSMDLIRVAISGKTLKWSVIASNVAPSPHLNVINNSVLYASVHDKQYYLAKL